MLESIRKGQRWLTGILIALVGGVFVFFMGLGGPPPSGPSLGFVVELGEIQLTPADFRRTRAQQAEAFREQLGDQFDTKSGRNFLDSQALRALIDRAVLAHEAYELGLRVGKGEIQRVIRNSAGFRGSDGRFNNEEFASYVQYEYGNQRNYLEYMRRALLGQKMAQLLYGQGEVSEGEARAAVLYRLQEVQIAYVAFDTEAAEGVEVSDEAAEQYAETHEAELVAAYEARLDEFRTPAQIRLRHILFELGPEAPPEEVRSAEAEAEAALARLEAGEAFEDLAREVSDDASTREAGGDLGLVTPDEIASELAAAARALAPGELSPVTRTDNGLHIVRLEERVEAGSRPFEEVRIELARDAARRQAARDNTDEQSDQLATAIRAGKSLEQAAREREIPIERTGALRRRPDGFVPGLGASQELLATAFALTPEKPTSPEIFTVGTKLVLIQLLEKKDPEPEVLAQALRGERERLEAGKRSSFLQNWIDERRTELSAQGLLKVDNSILQDRS